MSDVQILRVVGHKGKRPGILATIDGHTVEYRHDRAEWWCKIPGQGDCTSDEDECDLRHILPVKALIHPAAFEWSDG